LSGDSCGKQIQCNIISSLSAGILFSKYKSSLDFRILSLIGFYVNTFVAPPKGVWGVRKTKLVHFKFLDFLLLANFRQPCIFAVKEMKMDIFPTLPFLAMLGL